MQGRLDVTFTFQRQGAFSASSPLLENARHLMIGSSMRSRDLSPAFLPLRYDSIRRAGHVFSDNDDASLHLPRS
jgi:hypothetical protein